MQIIPEGNPTSVENVGDRDVGKNHLFRILETQPCETLSCLEMTQGRIPAAAISMILSLLWLLMMVIMWVMRLNLMWLGSGRPLMNTPPSWFTRPWPETFRYQRQFGQVWEDMVGSCFQKRVEAQLSF